MIDFDSKTAIIILTNRVHPDDKGSGQFRCAKPLLIASIV